MLHSLASFETEILAKRVYLPFKLLDLLANGLTLPDWLNRNFSGLTFDSFSAHIADLSVENTLVLTAAWFYLAVNLGHSVGELAIALLFDDCHLALLPVLDRVLMGLQVRLDRLIALHKG